MINIQSAFLLSIYILQCTARKDPIFPKPAGNFPDPNDYVDDVVHRVRELILSRKIDPYTTIDSELLKVHVNGVLYGLGTLTRDGDSSVIFKSNKIWCVESKLKAHLLKMELKWKTSVFGYTISGGASVSIQEVLIDVGMDVDFTEKSYKLQKFEVDEVGVMNVDVNVIPIFDFVVNTVSNTIMSVVKNILFRLVDGPVRHILQQVIDQHVLEMTQKNKI